MELRPRHWAIALVGAIALHASALVLFWQPSSAETAVAAGLGGIEVFLGPAGAPSGSMTASSDAETVEPVTAETSQATPVTPEEVPTEVAEAETSVEAVEPVEPEPVETAEPVEPVTPVEVAEVPAQEPEPVEEVELAEVVPLPEPPPAKPEPPRQVAEAPAPSPAAPAPAAPAPAAAEPAEQPALTPTTEEPGDAGKSGDTQLSAAGTGATTSGGGVPGAISDDYAALLSSWIDKNHEFPERLSRRKLYGQAVVSFTIDRGGNLLNYAIVRSSGHERLDAAAIATLKRASPMPAMPPELPGTQYTGQIPIGFDPPS